MEQDHRTRTTDDDFRRIAGAVHAARIDTASTIAALATIERWDATPEPLQTVAVLEVARRLGSAFCAPTFRHWWTGGSSRLRPLCAVCQGRGCFSVDSIDGQGRVTNPRPAACLALHVSHRLATFRHDRFAGLELTLIPGAERDPMTKRLEPISPFLIGRWPVTVEQAATILGVTATRETAEFPLTGGVHPAALNFAASAGLRLPRAAEIIHASEAGSPSRFYFGPDMDLDHCWIRANSGIGRGRNKPWMRIPPNRRGARYPRPHPPQEHEDAAAWNAFGLVDTLGNVHQWSAEGPQPERSTGLIGGCYRSSETLLCEADTADHACVGLRFALSIPGGPP